ncbi:hypothetical protein [Spongiactinospora sp. 9N601]|uniref:hypothetical protein n=1 Tax=Spongiactinospora sp. 9N601 TaxID=3375149 RepID=UPI0037A44896
MNQSDKHPREINAMMVSKILSMPPQPYHEGAYALRVIQVRGRHTGKARSVPIAVVQLAGIHYLAAPNRRRHWVMNLLASGECLIRGEGEGPSQAVLVEGEEAARVIKAYLAVLDIPFAAAAFPFSTNDSLETIIAHTGSTAVFRLQSPRRA